MAAPAPTSITVSRKRANDVSPKVAFNSPINATTSPNIKTNFLPRLSWNTPMGIESSPNITNPTNGMNEATVLLS